MASKAKEDQTMPVNKGSHPSLYKCPNFSLRKNPLAKLPKKANHQAQFRLGGKPITLTIPETRYDFAYRLAKQMVQDAWENWRLEISDKLGGSVVHRKVAAERGGGSVSKVQLVSEEIDSQMDDSEEGVGESKNSGVNVGVKIVGKQSSNGLNGHLPLQPLVDLFLKEKYHARRKSGTVKSATASMMLWVRLSGAKKLGDLNKACLTGLQVKLRNNFCKGYVQQSWGKLVKFLKWLVDGDYIERLPLANMKLEDLTDSSGTKRTTRGIWREDLMQAVIAASVERDRERLKMLWLTGLAPIDLITLEPKHIVTGSDGTLYIDKTREKSKSKGELIRLPLTGPCEEAGEIVQRALDLLENGVGRFYLFNREGLDCAGVAADMQRRLKLLFEREFPNESRLDLYSFRHSFATRMAEAGVAEYILQRWMGHKPGSKELHSIYVHVYETTKDMNRAGRVGTAMKKKRLLAFRTKGKEVRVA
jgi:integrase